MALTQKQERFVQEYLVDLNATAAAKRAGYKDPNIGRQLITKNNVSTAIQEAQQARSERTEITQDMVILELAKLGFFDIRRLFDENGKPLDISKLDDDTAAALVGLDVQDIADSDGNYIGFLKKYKMADKIRALELLGKHLGAWDKPDKKPPAAGDDPLTQSIKEHCRMAFSEKQLAVLRFPYTGYDALICDGAVRSGKTSVMSLSFLLWAMARFDRCSFAFCGKSVGSVERNMIHPLLGVGYLQEEFALRYNRGSHALTVRRGARENTVYLFGGKDESSYSLIQGVTLAGVLLDEAALMPRSFVEQALARCSVDGAKFWFNCNPENPMHWFRQEWILHPDKHNALHLHFLMDDNPSLTEATRKRYENTYSGVFYQRYVLGLWVAAEGVVYSVFDESANVYRPDQRPLGMAWASQRTIAVDYGTANPTRFLDIYDDGEVIRVDREYDWDSRKEHRQKTDQEYADDLLAFMGGSWCTVIVDPSAASFIAELRRRGVYVVPAENNVPDGIRRTAALIARRVIQVCGTCDRLIDEMGCYIWDEKASQRGEEKPVKQNDHSADALRYYVNSLPEWRFD